MTMAVLGTKPRSKKYRTAKPNSTLGGPAEEGAHRERPQTQQTPIYHADPTPQGPKPRSSQTDKDELSRKITIVGVNKFCRIT